MRTVKCNSYGATIMLLNSFGDIKYLGNDVTDYYGLAG